MKIAAVIFCALTWLMSAAIAQGLHTQSNDAHVMDTHHSTGESEGLPATIVGYVRDVACLLRNPKAGAATTPLTQDCMKKCVRGGSPIGILSEDGLLYTPISDVIPDSSVRARLLPYVGKYVKASGQVLERGGMHAISITRIEVIRRPEDSKIPTL